MKSTLIPAHLNCIWNLVFPKFKFNLSKFEGYLDKLMENAIAVFSAFIGRWSLFWKTEILILSGSGEFAAMPSQIRNDGLLSDHLSSVCFIFFSLRFDSRSFDLARIIRDNETLFRKRYPMFTNIRNMWIKKYHTMSRWRNAYVIGNHQVTLYHFVSLRFTFTEFKTFSILRFRSCFLRATWSVSCTFLLMMKNYNNLFQQTTITHTKKTFHC